VSIIQPTPSIGLGMLLVASCPAGHVSNFLTHYSRGNTALSVSVSATSTLLALIMTPLNFAFWGNLHPLTHDLMREFRVSPADMLAVIFLLLGLPLALGLWLAQAKPTLAHKLQKPMKIFSLIALASFILGALGANFKYFMEYIHLVLGVVFMHNLLALVTGYGLSSLIGLKEFDRRAITFEMGIQNSGLGLILIFDFFDGLGGMAIITAWWGVWHIVAGMALATFWRRRDPHAVGNAAVTA
jgi:BASS family bile acid:Na+ symporter